VYRPFSTPHAAANLVLLSFILLPSGVYGAGQFVQTIDWLCKCISPGMLSVCRGLQPCATVMDNAAVLSDYWLLQID